MTWSAHVVVACVVEHDGKFLIVEEDVAGARCFNQPAGHWEAGETLIEAARREALEETGWDVEPTDFLGIYEFKPAELEYTFLRIAFVAKAIKHHPERALDDGIAAAHWLTRDEVLARNNQHRGPAVMRCIDDYLSGQRYPLSLIAHLKDLR
ncbi:NUDIX hydrolase [Stenotrophobium rhamnosiphilum]|uniref:Phosphatase NudJ n=1 Tax=Stenotrophobium rhamnosiphilum TaxID=2029166 RepID=A0A2T5MH72_9GAMM|nr:NUDIX hydrolase [Stenotrophobium rhamnosiphilum]PTU31931.1 NUDIX hydrolase [Stenotrophobium rhamnosiphilum]